MRRTFRYATRFGRAGWFWSLPRQAVSKRFASLPRRRRQARFRPDNRRMRSPSGRWCARRKCRPIWGSAWRFRMRGARIYPRRLSFSGDRRRASRSRRSRRKRCDSCFCSSRPRSSRRRSFRYSVNWRKRSRARTSAGGCWKQSRRRRLSTFCAKSRIGERWLRAARRTDSLGRRYRCRRHCPRRRAIVDMCCRGVHRQCAGRRIARRAARRATCW
jgi:hypothetical protein